MSRDEFAHPAARCLKPGRKYDLGTAEGVAKALREIYPPDAAAEGQLDSLIDRHGRAAGDGVGQPLRDAYPPAAAADGPFDGLIDQLRDVPSQRTQPY
jgi:hypothetical protein